MQHSIDALFTLEMKQNENVIIMIIVTRMISYQYYHGILQMCWKCWKTTVTHTEIISPRPVFIASGILLIAWLILGNQTCFYSSIHLQLKSKWYPKSGRGGNSSSRGPQRSLSLATLTSSDWGIPRRSQARVEIQYVLSIYSPQSASWPSLRPDVPGTPSWGGPYKMSESPQLAPFYVKEQQLYPESLVDD